MCQHRICSIFVRRRHEAWFGLIERQALHRAVVVPVPEPNKWIRACVTGWNDRCDPCVWTRTSTEILKTPTGNHLEDGPLTKCTDRTR